MSRPSNHKSSPPKRVMAHLNWSSPGLWHGLRAYAREAGWLLDAPPWPSGPPKHPRVFDGVIVLIDVNTFFDVRNSFPGAKIVDINGVDGLNPDGLVIIDEEHVGRMAADYLHKIGCRSFLGLDAAIYWRGVHERITAFGERLRTLGVASEAIKVAHYGDWGKYEAGNLDAMRRQLKRALAKMTPPVGAFGPGSHVTDVFEQGIMELGYRVPEDVAVLASNAIPSICDMARVPLSSVDVNLSKLGYEAARLLDRLMSGDRTAPREIVIPPLGIEKRRSTERTNCDDPVVATMLEYIREHFMEKITAERIIRDVHVSRASAFARFRKTMGRSIGEEIERMRIGHAQSLLTTTDYKVEAVARLSGYLDTSAFCRVFRKAVGESPTEFRHRIGTSP